MLDKASQIRRVRTLANDKALANFFGEVIIKYEHGNVVCIEVTEVKRLDSAGALEEVRALAEEEHTEQVTLKKRSDDVRLVRVSKKGPLEEMVPIVRSSDS